mmetsp:Transcript_28149/g.65111  ORF Transcript_28149/g.65111 Transcript_28149/m.65111 type:complete len:80 (-) Transcript_28149:737-976(-)
MTRHRHNGTDNATLAHTVQHDMMQHRYDLCLTETHKAASILSFVHCAAAFGGEGSKLSDRERIGHYPPQTHPVRGANKA